MFTGRLKTYFTINTAFFLFAGMLLINMVLVKIDQRALVKSEISKGFILVSALENSLRQSLEKKNVFFNSNNKYLFRELLKEAGFNFALFSDPKNKQKYFFGDCGINRDRLVQLTHKAFLTKKKITAFDDSVWGLFWKENRYMIISSPLFVDQKTTASVSIVLDLLKIYNQTRQTQQIVFIYILINTVILTIISVKRFSRVTVTPLKRMLARVEDFREDEDFFLIHEKESDEFSRLSSSLHRMLKQISGDKEKLRETVTSLKKTNLQLKEAQKDLVKAEKLASVGRLSAGIAHEIGNPVSIIIGYLELLKQHDISDKEKKDFLCRTEVEINRINIIIRQLLNFSRTPEEFFRKFSVHELLNDISTVFEMQPLLADIKLELHLSAEEDIITADSDQLRQVFMNLMINAADSIASAPEKVQGKINISTSKIEKPLTHTSVPIQMLKIIFTDNGPGISDADIEKIFDPFYTTKEPGKGTGLGLYVCFMIIDKIGGTIKAASEKKNTTLTILLPFDR